MFSLQTNGNEVSFIFKFLFKLFECIFTDSVTALFLFVVLQTVVFCLVDIYIILGKAFLPYLKGLNSTQLRLVTIYANRISQARSGPVNCD